MVAAPLYAGNAAGRSSLRDPRVNSRENTPTRGMAGAQGSVDRVDLTTSDGDEAMASYGGAHAPASTLPSSSPSPPPLQDYNIPSTYNVPPTQYQDLTVPATDYVPDLAVPSTYFAPLMDHAPCPTFQDDSTENDPDRRERLAEMQSRFERVWDEDNAPTTAN